MWVFFSGIFGYHRLTYSLAGYALQSWLFAQLIQVFQLTGQRLVDQANFWALMFFVLAIAMAIFYFLLGASANTMSMVYLKACLSCE